MSSDSSCALLSPKMFKDVKYAHLPLSLLSEISSWTVSLACAPHSVLFGLIPLFKKEMFEWSPSETHPGANTLVVSLTVFLECKSFFINIGWRNKYMKRIPLFYYHVRNCVANKKREHIMATSGGLGNWLCRGETAMCETTLHCQGGSVIQVQKWKSEITSAY